MDTTYKPTYHASVNSGWSNDPNGMIYYNNQYHLFFQHYPHGPTWGIMHWGHYTSDNLITWQERDIALYPDQPYEETYGCWSGTAIEKDGRLYLMYTGSTPERQTQCLAFSDDGLHFTKYEHNPVINTHQLPDIADHRNFRDPKVFYENGRYYALMGSKINDFGNILLFQSDDLYSWSYVGHLFDHQDHIPEAFFHLQGVYECPDFFKMDGYDILLSSPQHLPQMGCEFENENCSIAMLGHLDLITGHYDIISIQEIDGGLDFYAPQTLRAPDGRIIMIAWKEMWFRTNPTAPHGWIGSYTLPRNLTIRDQRLYQQPIEEIKAFYRDPVIKNDIFLRHQKMMLQDVSGNKIALHLEIDLNQSEDFSLECFKCGDRYVTLSYRDHHLVLDRTHMGTLIKDERKGTEEMVRTCALTPSDTLTLDLFLDVSSLEVFINDGRYCMTANIYGDPHRDTGITFSTRTSCLIRHLEKHNIIID